MEDEKDRANAPRRGEHENGDSKREAWHKTADRLPSIGKRVEGRWNHRPGESWTVWLRYLNLWSCMVTEAPERLKGPWTCNAPDEWRFQPDTPPANP